MTRVPLTLDEKNHFIPQLFKTTSFSADKERKEFSKMQSDGVKKKHSTMMREFRELEKRLLNLQREHNKLTKQRNFYCKSASSTRPYLSEKIVAKLRPQTAPLGYLNKRTDKDCHISTTSKNPTDFEENFTKTGQEAMVFCSEEEAERKSLTYGNEKVILNRKNEKNESSPVRVASSKASVGTKSRETSANYWRRYPHNNQIHGRPPSVSSRNSSARDRNSSAHTRSLPSEFSHRHNKPWVYHPMSKSPERQSIYTLVIPPVQAAEESKKRLKKRKRQGGAGRHVAWMDNSEHVMRFQGIPKKYYVHENEHKNTEYDMEDLKNCRYLR